MVAEAIRARRAAQAWLARQHMRETMVVTFDATYTDYGNAGVVAVMWRGLGWALPLAAWCEAGPLKEAGRTRSEHCYRGLQPDRFTWTHIAPPIET